MDYKRLFELSLFCLNYYLSKGRAYKYANSGKIFRATDFEIEKKSEEYARVYQKLVDIKNNDRPNGLTKTKE